MKELMNDLMNHGYSKDQAQRFLGKCVITFRNYFKSILISGSEDSNEKLADLLGVEHVEVRKHDNETVGD